MSVMLSALSLWLGVKLSQTDTSVGGLPSCVLQTWTFPLDSSTYTCRCTRSTLQITWVHIADSMCENLHAVCLLAVSCWQNAQ